MNIIKKFLDIIVWILFSLILLILSVLLYIKYLWPDADYEQIVFTIQDTPITIILDNIVYQDIIFGFLFFVIVFPLCYLYLKLKYVIGLCLLFSFCIAYISGFIHYQIYSRTQTTLYDMEYIDPEKIEYQFPDKKKNLLLIYMESFENDFHDAKNYGKNLIPNLKNLQKEGEFSGKHYVLSGSNYSIAALISSMCGIPLKFSKKRTIRDTKFFLDGATCFPEILKDNGYQTLILKAADIKYTRADIFALRHGFNEALGVNETKDYFIKNNYKDYEGTFGGINDRALFDYAKMKINEFDKNKPFFLTLFSLDTHMPGYYLDKECKADLGDLRDAFICSDKGVYDFVEWFKTTPFYENTTVVIVGDHTLSSKLKGKAKAKHGIYNVFLNLEDGLKIKENKAFSTYDLAPTILEAIGVNIKPRGFALGRSLFDDKKTLVEEQGNVKLKYELMKNSELYNKLKEPRDKILEEYKLYKIGDEILEKDFPLYTNDSEEFLGRHYIDKMNFLFDNYKGNDLEVEMKFYAVIGFDNTLDVFIGDNKIYSCEMPKMQKQPLSYKFKIKKDLIKDNKLQLLFHNNGAGISAVNIGISVQSMRIVEK